VGSDENAAVHQAAEFLAGDIEKISGQKPAMLSSPGAAAVHIRLVTVGHGTLPPKIHAESLQGQWESYRVATDSRDVWLVGSNPR